MQYNGVIASLPKITVIHDFEEGFEACKNALYSKQPICLTLPEKLAHGAIGPALFHHMTQKAMDKALRDDKLKDCFVALYPCGDRAGDVLASLAIGIRHIAYHGRAFEPLLDVAKTYQACLYPYQDWEEKVKTLP